MAAVIAAIVGTGLILAAEAPAARTVFHDCSYEGPQWKFSSGQTGTTWVLNFQNTTCVFAKPYAKKLATRPIPKHYGAAVPGGPRGWRCQALMSGPGKIISGSCTNGTKFFGWHAAS
jgi:hypothetical protein